MKLKIVLFTLVSLPLISSEAPTRGQDMSRVAFLFHETRAIILETLEEHKDKPGIATRLRSSLIADQCLQVSKYVASEPKRYGNLVALQAMSGYEEATALQKTMDEWDEVWRTEFLPEELAVIQSFQSILSGVDQLTGQDHRPALCAGLQARYPGESSTISSLRIPEGSADTRP